MKKSRFMHIYSPQELFLLKHVKLFRTTAHLSQEKLADMLNTLTDDPDMKFTQDKISKIETNGFIPHFTMFMCMSYLFGWNEFIQNGVIYGNEKDDAAMRKLAREFTLTVSKKLRMTKERIKQNEKRLFQK